MKKALFWGLPCWFEESRLMVYPRQVDIALLDLLTPMLVRGAIFLQFIWAGAMSFWKPNDPPTFSIDLVEDDF